MAKGDFPFLLGDLALFSGFMLVLVYTYTIIYIHILQLWGLSKKSGTPNIGSSPLCFTVFLVDNLPFVGLIRPVDLEGNWQFIRQILDDFRGDGGRFLGKIPSLKLTFSTLRIDGWNTTFLLGRAIFQRKC